MIEIMREFKEWDTIDLDLDTEEGMKEFNKIMDDRNDFIEALKEDIEKFTRMINNMTTKMNSYSKNKVITVGDNKMNSIDVNKSKLDSAIKHLKSRIETNKELILNLERE